MIVALIICGIIGAANGFAVAVHRDLLVRDDARHAVRAERVTLVMSHATPINTPGTTILGGTTFEKIFGGGTYSELIWALGIVVILQVVLSFTRWGIYTVAVGGNRLGASEAGIGTKKMLIRNFMMCAVLAAFVGILEAVRTTTATPDPSGANDILFQAISAAVIGGTLLQGGSGTVIGALIGALFLGILHDGLTIKGVNANYLNLYLGLAILLAMAIEHLRGTRENGVRPWLTKLHPHEHIVEPTMADDDVLRVEHVGKSFGATIALRDISLHLRKGEVLGLLGDNGAGKSTLIKILAGFQKPDTGSLWVKGEPYTPRSVDEGRKRGIDCVFQDLALINELSVYQNLFLQRREGPPADPVPLQRPDAPRGSQGARSDRDQHPLDRCPGGPSLRRPAPGDRGRADDLGRRRHHPARRAAGRDGRQGGGDDPRPHRSGSRKRATSRSS